jgi:hypothetical protein
MTNKRAVEQAAVSSLEGINNMRSCCDMAEKRESNGCPVCGMTKQCRCYVPKKSIGKLTVDIDCSDALKGLKAVTREAKKATAALKELEEQQSKSVTIKIDGPILNGTVSKAVIEDIDKQLKRQKNSLRFD